MLRPIAAISAGQTAVKLCLQLAIENLKSQLSLFPLLNG